MINVMMLRFKHCLLDIKFYEVLEIYSSNTTVEVRLNGQGVKPQLSLEPSDKTFDVGDALVMDTMYQTLKVLSHS